MEGKEKKKRKNNQRRREEWLGEKPPSLSGEKKVQEKRSGKKAGNHCQNETFPSPTRGWERLSD